MKRPTLGSVDWLCEADPLFRALAVIDKYLGVKNDWNEIHQRIPQDQLVLGLWHFLGHPIQYRNVNRGHVQAWEQWLEKSGEPNLARIVRYMVSEKVRSDDIRRAMIWLVANIEYLKERQARETGVNFRSIYAGVIEIVH